MANMEASSPWSWLAPTLIFIGAMITLYVTNRRADRREWNKWRRDTLLKLCADAVDASYEAETAYENGTTMDEADFAKVRFEAATKAARRITSVTEQLNLVGASFLAQTCRDMRAAVDRINGPAWTLRVARNNEKKGRARATEAIEREHPEWLELKDRPDADYAIAWARTTVDLYNAWIAAPQAEFKESAAELEKVRARFIKRGQSELKSTN
jgi:hypothetical protein